MTVKDVSTWIGIIIAIATGGVSWGVNSEKIEQLEKKTENQHLVREQQIRMEERQKVIQQDVQDTKLTIEEIKELIQDISE